MLPDSERNRVIQKILADAARDIEKKISEATGLPDTGFRVATICWAVDSFIHKTTWKPDQFRACIAKMAAHLKKSAH